MSVLLIDPFSSGAHYHGLLQEAGLTYYTIRTQRALDSGLSTGEAVPSLVVDHASEEQLGDIMCFCRDRRIDTVITSTESGVPLAEALKIQLGLASGAFEDQGRRFWDKPLLYATVRDAGMRVPEHVGAFTAHDVASGHHRSALQTVVFPVVVKPDVGAGSVGVRTVDTVEQCLEAIESVVSAPGFFGGQQPPSAVVQELVHGREYVIDTVSHAGEHHVVAVCTYDKHPSSNGTMVYDRLRWLDWESSEAATLTAYAHGVLQALDHREGSVHMEAILDKNGPCLIDLGVRPHGAGHPLKTHTLTGSSQLHAEVATAAGLETPAPAGYQLGAHAAIEFLSLEKPATVRADANPTEILDQDFVLSGEVPARPGMTYPETHSLLDSEALGLVFVSGMDDEDVIANSLRLRRSFEAMLEEVGHAH